MIDHVVTFVIVALLTWWVLADQMGWNHRSCCRCCCKDDDRAPAPRRNKGKTRITIANVSAAIIGEHGGPMQTGDLIKKLRMGGQVKLTGNASNTVGKTLRRDKRFYNVRRGYWDLASRRDE